MNIAELSAATDEVSDYQTIDKQTAFIALDHLCAYRVSGDDAKSFLQGQLSNDLEKTTPAAATLNAYCTPKGRMLAIFYLVQWQQDYIMILPADTAAAVVQRLTMYVMRAKVVFEQVDDAQLFGIADPHGALINQVCAGRAPERPYQSVSDEHTLCMRAPAETARYIILSRQTLDLSQLAHDVVCRQAYWLYLDIINGIPSLCEALKEAFVPQMANMELIDGVSFKKGCYPGQEVVARLHYLGNSNRRMFQFSCACPPTIAAGDDIHDATTQRVVGKVVSAVKQPHTSLGLAIIHIASVKTDHLTLHDTALSILTLPYAVPLEEAAEKKL